jgi:hypothetical protein
MVWARLCFSSMCPSLKLQCCCRRACIAVRTAPVSSVTDRQDIVVRVIVECELLLSSIEQLYLAPQSPGREYS